MAGNMERALWRIRRNKKTKAKFLDLNGLGLTELPDELWDCIWVEELGLGYNYSWDEEREFWAWDWDDEKKANQLTHLPISIVKLVNLVGLVLDHNPIKVDVLSQLPNLKSINLRHTPVENLDILKNSKALTSLDLFRTEVRDISTLADLKNLTSLDLGETSVKNVDALSSLEKLTHLSLKKTLVNDITALSSLVNLTNLNLSDTGISEIESICNLDKLVKIDLSYTRIKYFPFVLLYPTLTDLALSGTKCINIPSELIEEPNALFNLRNYSKDLLQDSYFAYEAKQIIVGNGRVGKTSLLKTLYDLGNFDPNEDSTHGIKMFNTTLSLPQKQASADLCIWDFGGQEIYHATHRIFLQIRAIYLVIWDPITEANLGEQTINLCGQNFNFRNYPLSYWLGNVRALSPSAKIIVVCNKSDAGEEYFPSDLHALQQEYDIDSFITVSAKTGYGITYLRQRIQYLLSQMPEMGMQMPGSWRRVREKLQAIQSKRYISLKYYRNLCTTEGLNPSSKSTLLDFFYLSGFVFKHKYLGKQILLDQKWALEAIYHLLDRNGWYILLKGNALRRYSELSKCWREYKPEQINLFLEMMQSCELALKINFERNNDPTYLIPEFLPDNPAPAVSDIWESNINSILYFRFQHPFFHAALIQRFIVRSAKLAERYDLLWRTGLLLKVEGTLSLVQVYPEIGRIDIQLRGTNPSNLLERLKNEILEIQDIEEEAGFLVSLTSRPDEWVSLEHLKLQISKGKNHVASTTGEILELAPFLLLLSLKNLDRDIDHNGLGLKELADQESGSQLLQPTEPSSPLHSFQNQVKSQLIDGIPAAITLLRQSIAANTSTFDDLILIHGQYQRYHEDLTLYDVLSAEERRIGYNKIQKAILELVNSLEPEDLKA